MNKRVIHSDRQHCKQSRLSKVVALQLWSAHKVLININTHCLPTQKHNFFIHITYYCCFVLGVFVIFMLLPATWKCPCLRLFRFPPQVNPWSAASAPSLEGFVVTQDTVFAMRGVFLRFLSKHSWYLLSNDGTQLYVTDYTSEVILSPN